MHLVPETGDGIVILANSQRAWPLFAAILRDWSVSLGVGPGRHGKRALGRAGGTRRHRPWPGRGGARPLARIRGRRRPLPLRVAGGRDRRRSSSGRSGPRHRTTCSCSRSCPASGPCLLPPPSLQGSASRRSPSQQGGGDEAPRRDGCPSGAWTQCEASPPKPPGRPSVPPRHDPSDPHREERPEAPPRSRAVADHPRPHRGSGAKGPASCSTPRGRHARR
jgi:hypothetical protein